MSLVKMSCLCVYLDHVFGGTRVTARSPTQATKGAFLEGHVFKACVFLLVSDSKALIHFITWLPHTWYVGCSSICREMALQHHILIIASDFHHVSNRVGSEQAG